MILRGLRGGWKGFVSSLGPEEFPGVQGPIQTALDGVWRLYLPLQPHKKERVPRWREEGYVFRYGQLLLCTRFEMGTKGSLVRVEQIIFGLQMLPDGPPALTQTSARAGCPLEPKDVVGLLISFPTLDSKALSGKIKSPSTLLNFFKKHLVSPVIWK